MTRILRVSLLVVVRFIVGLSESRIIADFSDWQILPDGGVFACLFESRISRMARIEKPSLIYYLPACLAAFSIQFPRLE